MATTTSPSDAASHRLRSRSLSIELESSLTIVRRGRHGRAQLTGELLERGRDLRAATTHLGGERLLACERAPRRVGASEPEIGDERDFLLEPRDVDEQAGALARRVDAAFDERRACSAVHVRAASERRA